MIWIILGFVLFNIFGGDAPLRDSIEAVQERIADTVEDSDRRERAEATLEQLLGGLQVAEKSVQAKAASFVAALQEHDSKRETIAARLDAIMVDRVKFQRRMVVARVALREQLTREEWAVVFGPR